MSTTSLLRTRRFLPLFCTQFLGAFNDNFLKNALIILIAFKSVNVLGLSPEQMVPAAAGIFILPFFLFSASAGQISDKFEKSTIIKWIKAAEIIIMLIASLGFLKEYYGLVLLALFLMGLHSTFFGPLKYSILPQLLKPEELVEGNALIEAGTFLAILLGTISGGVLIAQKGTGPTIVSSGLLIVALLGFLTGLKVPLAPSTAQNERIQWNPIVPTYEIFKFTKKNRAVFLAIMGISWFWFFGASILTLFPIYGKGVLSADESVVTLFLALFSIGIGAGSILCGRLSKHRLELGLVPLGSFGMTIFILDLFVVGKPNFNLSTTLPLTAFELFHTSTGIRIIFDLLMLSVFSGLFIVPLYTLIQERTDSSHRSRVVAGNNVINAFFMVGASLLLMALLKLKVTVPQIFLVLGVLNFIASIYIYFVLPEFLMRFIAWGLANVIYRIRNEGVENIPQEGPALLVCNHVTFIDWLVISAVIDRPIRFVMDHNYVVGMFMRILLKQAKVILIAPAHESVQIMEEAFQQIAHELRDNQLVCIFPEGKLTSTGAMSVFKPGVERILQETPVPVIPMALRGFWGSFFSRYGGKAFSHKPRFLSRIELKIGKVIGPQAATKEALFHLVQELRGPHP